MKAFLTIFGSLMIFSAAHAVDEKALLDANLFKQGQSTSFPSSSTTKNKIDIEKLQQKDLNKNLQQNQKFQDLLRSLGGATSGGGDDLGLEVQRVLSVVSKMIDQDSQLYPARIKQALLTKAATLKIIVTDEVLPATTGQLSQYGAAYSIYDGSQSIMLIQRSRWTAISNPSIKDSLIHHELAVLAGVETTGDYHLTNAFYQQSAKFWESFIADSFACTFSLYENRNGNLGAFEGSTGIVANSASTVADFAVIHDLEPHTDGKANRTAIVRYVITNQGYFRGAVSESNVVYYKQSGWKKLGNIINSTPERVYFSPYDMIDSSRSASLEKWGDHFIQVACSKL